MGFLDRLLGREPRDHGGAPQHTGPYGAQPSTQPANPYPTQYPAQQPAYGSAPQDARPAAGQRTPDQVAIDRYRYLLRTAPPDAVEQAHAEAFARLTPEQRRQVLAELGEQVPAGSGRRRTHRRTSRAWRRGRRCGSPGRWSAPSRAGARRAPASARWSAPACSARSRASSSGPRSRTPSSGPRSRTRASPWPRTRQRAPARTRRRRGRRGRRCRRGVGRGPRGRCRRRRVRRRGLRRRRVRRLRRLRRVLRAAPRPVASGAATDAAAAPETHECPDRTVGGTR